MKVKINTYYQLEFLAWRVVIFANHEGVQYDWISAAGAMDWFDHLTPVHQNQALAFMGSLEDGLASVQSAMARHVKEKKNGTGE